MDVHNKRDSGKLGAFRRFLHFAMASLGRATAGASSSEELQLWQTVRTQLKSLENARSASLAGYERLVRAQSESPTKSVEGIYNVVENCILDEQR